LAFSLDLDFDLFFFSSLLFLIINKLQKKESGYSESSSN